MATVAPTVALTPVAHAEDAITRTAKRHFQKGEKFFALGQFEEALEEYQKAFDAIPRPGFLFNIGQCYSNLSQYDEAIFAFRRYLTLEPEAPNKDAVQILIAELEEKKARAEAKQPPPNKKKPPTGTSTPVYKRWWFWTGLGVIAVAGGAAGYVATRPEGAPATTFGDISINK